MAKIGFNTNRKTERLGLYCPQVFPTKVAVMTFDEDIHDLGRLVDTPADLEDMDHVTFGGHDKNTGENLLCVAFRKTPTLTDVAHEASHAATAYCYIHDLSFRPNDDEAHAFLTEWIFKCVCDFFNININSKY